MILWPTATAGTIIVPQLIALFANRAISVGQTSIIVGRTTIGTNTACTHYGIAKQQLQRVLLLYRTKGEFSLRVLVCKKFQISGTLFKNDIFMIFDQNIA